MGKKSGFTLIELVVAIAVIGILAGIAIPRFQQAQAEALGAKVLANLRAMDSAINVYMTKTGHIPTNIEQITTNNTMTVPPCYQMIEALDTSNGRDFLIKHTDGKEQLYNVPTTGVYGISKGRATFGGTIRTADWYLGINADMGSNMQAIMEAIGTFSDKTTNLDSGAANITGSYASALSALLEETGIDLAAMGAQSWHYTKNSGGILVWTSADISTMQPDDKVPIIQYKQSTGNYTVWTTTVKAFSGTIANIPGNVSYNTLGLPNNSGAYKPSTSNNTNGNQTYEKAQEYYDTLKAQS